MPDGVSNVFSLPFELITPILAAMTPIDIGSGASQNPRAFQAPPSALRSVPLALGLLLLMPIVMLLVGFLDSAIMWMVGLQLMGPGEFNMCCAGTYVAAMLSTSLLVAVVDLAAIDYFAAYHRRAFPDAGSVRIAFALVCFFLVFTLEALFADIRYMFGQSVAQDVAEYWDGRFWSVGFPVIAVAYYVVAAKYRSRKATTDDILHIV